MSRKNNHLEKIMMVSQKLFFNHDYDSVSMSDIAKSVNITKAALYYHFDSKTDLYLKVLEENLSDLTSCLTDLINSEEFQKKSLVKKIEDILGVYFDFINRRNSILKLLVKKISTDNKKITSFLFKARKEIIDLFKPVSEEIIRHKHNTVVNHQDMTLFLFGMVTPFIHEQFHDKASDDSTSHEFSQVVARKVSSVLIA